MKLRSRRSGDAADLPVSQFQQVVHRFEGALPVVVHKHVDAGGNRLGPVERTEQQKRKVVLHDVPHQKGGTGPAENQGRASLFELLRAEGEFVVHLPEFHAETRPAKFRLQTEQQTEPVFAIGVDLVKHNPDDAEFFPVA